MTDNIVTINKQASKKPTSKELAKNFKVRKTVLKLSIIFIVLLVLGIGSWRVILAYEGKILPKVTIAGLNVGGKTPAEATTIVQSYINTLNQKGPEIAYEQETLKPKLNELGLTFDVKEVVKDAYSFGRSGNWQNRLSQNYKMVLNKHDIQIKFDTDEKKMDEYLSQVAQVVEIEPKNADLNIVSGNINLIAAKNGRGLDKEKLKSDISNLINDREFNKKIDLTTTTLKPDVLNEGTLEAQTQAEKYLNSAPIAITFEEQTFTADKNEIGSWIVFTPKDHRLIASVSNQKVASFAETISSRIEIAKIDKEVMEGTGEVLNEGQDGRGVDGTKLNSEIYNRVLSGNFGAAIAVGAFAIPKGEITKNPHAQPGRYAGKYIDVNLSEQTLYAFEGTNLVNQFLVSTGKTGPTPTGEFSVYAKTRSQVMDGPGYYLPNVEWISWWNGDYSIHGTYWHNNFGNPMSHGCINASNANAEWIYNWDDIGTPVYIHW